jgi:mono/diheme cytochrome c family protein
MAVNPVSGKVYVSNTEAFNLDRFEGPGVFAGESLRGHLHESRITVLTPGGGVAPRHLNKHIDYSTCCAPIPNAENAKSLALPQSMAITPDGSTLYVAALGSKKVGVFSTAALENDTFVPSTASHIPVSGGGPTGLALDHERRRLYVLTRFDNSISVLDTQSKTEVAHVPMYNPEPLSVRKGRPYLYDASFSSSHGDSACASCHVFGDFDSLAWDLGNPDAPVTNNPGPFLTELTNLITGEPIEPVFHPMKGPMTTQSLRGMANHGSMHWRGDRTGGNEAPSVQPDSGTFDERAAFKKFQAGFTDLLGRHAFISEGAMEAFTDFILQVTYPPNPIRRLDNELTPDQEAGRQLFNVTEAPIGICANCHKIDRDAGIFGGTGAAAFDFLPQLMKVPHLRNVYQKVGMFGMPAIPGLFPLLNNDHMGDQVRGFGILNDGAIDTPFRFLSALGFSQDFPGNPNGFLSASTPEGIKQIRQTEQFVLAFESNLAPIVGQQITLTHGNAAVVGPRIGLLMARADQGECDLVAKKQNGAHEHGYLYIGGGKFLTNRALLPPIDKTILQLLTTVSGHELTYTCVPPGSGERIGIDRDEDGHLDGDEQDAGSDPADPSSTPWKPWKLFSEE